MLMSLINKAMVSLSKGDEFVLDDVFSEYHSEVAISPMLLVCAQPFLTYKSIK